MPDFYACLLPHTAISVVRYLHHALYHALCGCISELRTFLWISTTRVQPVRTHSVFQTLDKSHIHLAKMRTNNVIIYVSDGHRAISIQIEKCLLTLEC